MTVEEPERPFLSRGLRVPDRVAAHLLGADDPDAALADVLAEVTPTPGGLADDLGRVLSSDRSGPGAPTPRSARGGRPVPDQVRLVYLRDHGRRTGSAVAAAALAAAGYGVVGLDLRRLATRPAPEELVRIAGREALLRGCRDRRRAGRGPDRRGRGRPAPARVAAGAGAARRRRQLGPGVEPRGAAAGRVAPARRGGPRAAVDRRAGQPDVPAVPGHLQLGPGQIGRAVRWAQLAATLDDRPVDRHLAPVGRPGAERRRARTPLPPRRAGRRLGRPRAHRRPSRPSCTSWPPGPGTARRSSPSGGCARAAAAATASPPCSPATPAPARRCRPR